MPAPSIGPSGTPGSMMHNFSDSLEKMETELAALIHRAGRLGSWDASDSAHGGLLVALRDTMDNAKKMSDAFTQRMASLWLGQMAQYAEYARAVEQALQRKFRKDFHEAYPQQQSHLHARRKAAAGVTEEMPPTQKRRSDLCESYGYIFDIADAGMASFVDTIHEQTSNFKEVVAIQTVRLKEARVVDEQRLQDAIKKVAAQVSLLAELIERKVRAAQWDGDQQKATGLGGSVKQQHGGLSADAEPTLY